MKYLHTMVRVTDVDASLKFYCDALGLEVLSRKDYPQGKFTLIFLAAPGDSTAQVELTHNWEPESYGGGRNFGHLAYAVDDIYAACERLQKHGVTINRPPRDGQHLHRTVAEGRSAAAARAVGVDAQHRQLVIPEQPERRAAFRAGQRAILQSLPGAATWGLVSGVAMVKGGLTVPWAMFMSLTVYAGSAQLAALPLIATGMPIWVIVATGLVTNLRFVIYSAALRPYFAHERLGKRAALGFFMTDFTFTLFMRAAQEGWLPERHRDAWFAGVCSNNWITWQISAMTGIVAASYVPADWGLEFTGTLALVALVGPALNARPALVGAVTAGVVALLAHGLPYRLGLFVAAIVGIIAATLADGWRAPRSPEAEAS